MSGCLKAKARVWLRSLQSNGRIQPEIPEEAILNKMMKRMKTKIMKMTMKMMRIMKIQMILETMIFLEKMKKLTKKKDNCN
jgi:hypothetical protein